MPLLKPRTIFLGLGILVAAGVVGYLINPLGTASWDPRARIFGVMPMRVGSNAMAPTLRQGDHVLVSAWAYAKDDPAVGDIAVFQSPQNREQAFMQRVIATGGSTVEIIDGQTLVDGVVFVERWHDDTPYLEPWSLQMEAVEVPQGHYFVMGDNRDISLDSRMNGTVPREHFMGRIDP